MSPRQYAARIELLRVQDCIAARMTPAEIARHLKKDRAWVSRAIRKLQAERRAAYSTDAEQAAIDETNRDFDRLLIAAMAIHESAGATSKGLAAIRAAGEALQEKVRFQLATGQIRRCDSSPEGTVSLFKTSADIPHGPAEVSMLEALILTEAEKIAASQTQQTQGDRSQLSVFDR